MRQLIAALFAFTLGGEALAQCVKQTHPPVDVVAYYQSTAGLMGEDLKDSLNQIIRDHTRYTYTPCVWAMLKEADEDPANADNVIAIYTGRPIPKSRRDDGTGDQDSWNREHIWSKSKGFRNRSQHAHTDGHHIVAADRSVNSDRSNNDFANGGEPDTECTGCREGDGTWEPPDEVKGDIARMMFYMTVRYEGSDDSGTPDLELVDRLTASGEPHFGKLCTLLSWHEQDGVSDRERRRNDIIHSWQGNRNPFIDRSEFVSAIWAGSCPGHLSAKEELLQRLERLESELNELRTIIEERL